MGKAAKRSLVEIIDVMAGPERAAIVVRAGISCVEGRNCCDSWPIVKITFSIDDSGRFN